jgi:L-alanine-DL-glutamate epimerase-like enolase superfamily enzyme
LRERLAEQLGAWAAEGMRFVKMKVGRVPQDDPARVRAARRAIENCELFVDANGAYTRKQALAEAATFAEQGVTWFEEPVSSDDLEGLRLIRDRAAAGMAIAAGEYGHHVRIEEMLFDGFSPARNGLMSPDRSRPGLGVELKARDAERYRC